MAEQGKKEKSEELHKYLYKYRSWSDPLHRRIITDREIWFASPRWFNDPFDSSIHMRYDESSREQIRRHYKVYFKNYGTDEEKTNFEQMADKEANHLINMSDDEYEIFMSTLQRKYDASTGIFTTSSKQDDILMWSHYSDSHKGFCVELDRKNLIGCTENYYQQTGLAIKLFKVKYEDDYPKLLGLPGMDSAEWMKRYVIKSLKWEDESEYRLMNLKTTDFPVQLNASVITKVILGCQMSDNDQEEIIHELLKQGGGIALEKAVKSKDKFGLEFVPVDY